MASDHTLSTRITPSRTIKRDAESGRVVAKSPKKPAAKTPAAKKQASKAIKPTKESGFGSMRGTGRILGDIVTSTYSK
ncbi:MAG: hypothetical protein V4441_07110 [Pseudomonadota bacterium]